MPSLSRAQNERAPEGGGRKPSFRDWVRGNGEPIFLSIISVVEIKAYIEKVRDARRADELNDWLEGIIANYNDRIYPVDAEVTRRAGALMNRRSQALGRTGRSLSDPLLAATAEIGGRSLLTERKRDFTPWAKIELWDPFEQGLRGERGGE